jgi:hypothetical protein
MPDKVFNVSKAIPKPKPKWRWLLLPLSPIAIPVGFLIGVRKILWELFFYRHFDELVKQWGPEKTADYIRQQEEWRSKKCQKH